MRNGTIVGLTLCFSLMAGPAALAQEWSQAQTEVWKNVEAYWARDAAGDTDGFLSYVHDRYIGWDLNEPITSNKSRFRKFIAHSHATEKTVLYDIQPLAINVFNDMAVVYYHYTFIAKNADGKEDDRSGRWADILMKQDSKWVLVDDDGGSTSED